LGVFRRGRATESEGAGPPNLTGGPLRRRDFIEFFRPLQRSVDGETRPPGMTRTHTFHPCALSHSSGPSARIARGGPKGAIPIGTIRGEPYHAAPLCWTWGLLKFFLALLITPSLGLSLLLLWTASFIELNFSLFYFGNAITRFTSLTLNIFSSPSTISRRASSGRLLQPCPNQWFEECVDPRFLVETPSDACWRSLVLQKAIQSMDGPGIPSAGKKPAPDDGTASTFTYPYNLTNARAANGASCYPPEGLPVGPPDRRGKWHDDADGPAEPQPASRAAAPSPVGSAPAVAR